MPLDINDVRFCAGSKTLQSPGLKWQPISFTSKPPLICCVQIPDIYLPSLLFIQGCEGAARARKGSRSKEAAWTFLFPGLSSTSLHTAYNCVSVSHRMRAMARSNACPFDDLLASGAFCNQSWVACAGASEAPRSRWVNLAFLGFG